MATTKPTPTRGTIAHIWVARCGGCSTATTLDGIGTPSDQAQALGWRRFVGRGWLCPRCISKAVRR